MNDEPDAVAQEAKRQTIILVFSLAGAVALIYIRTLQDVTTRNRLVMRSALRFKRFAQWNAQEWETLAEQAATIYNRYRD